MNEFRVECLVHAWCILGTKSVVASGASSLCGWGWGVALSNPIVSGVHFLSPYWAQSDFWDGTTFPPVVSVAPGAFGEC